MTDQPRYLKVNEVADELRIGRNLVYEKINAGELPSIRVGRHIRIPRQAFERWCAEREQDHD